MSRPRLLFEAKDVGLRLEPPVGPARVSDMARDGEIVPYAVTPRGVKLFTPAETRRAQQRRAARRVRVGK